MERTVVILKPDSIQRNLVGKIITMFEEKGLKIVGLKMLTLSQKVFEILYSHIIDKSYYQQTQEFMMSGPCIAIILEGPDAIQRVVTLCGPSNLNETEGYTIRGRFALWTGCDVIHRLHSAEEIEKTINLIFKTDDIHQYQKIDERFMYESNWDKNQAI